MNHKDLIEMLSNEEFLKSLDWVWPTTAKIIVDWTEHNHEVIEDLYNYWVKFDNPYEVLETQRLMGIKFSVTWKFTESRQDVILMMCRLWATFSPTITSNTNLLIVWEEPSSKIAKATKLWVEIITWIDKLKERFNL